MEEISLIEEASLLKEVSLMEEINLLEEVRLLDEVSLSNESHCSFSRVCDSCPGRFKLYHQPIVRYRNTLFDRHLRKNSKMLHHAQSALCHSCTNDRCFVPN